MAISAPLLLRSRALADIDLIGLIGRNGISHARAIARRPSLNGNIAALINALGIAPLGDAPGAPAESVPAPKAAERKPAGVAAEETREQLRAMMEPAQPAARAVRPDGPIDWVAAHAAYARMVATGMTGVAALFHTAVADAFDMGFEGARRMIEDEEGAGLATALKAAGLSAAEAFLVAALAFPPRIGTTAAIRDFVDRYRAIDVDDARRQVSAWRDKAPRSVVVQDQPAAAANSDDKPAPARRSLKAS